MGGAQTYRTQASMLVTKQARLAIHDAVVLRLTSKLHQFPLLWESTFFFFSDVLRRARSCKLVLLWDRGGERTFHVVGTLPSIDFEIVKMEQGNVTNCKRFENDRNTFLLKTFMNMLDTLVRENFRLQRVSRNESF